MSPVKHPCNGAITNNFKLINYFSLIVKHPVYALGGERELILSIYMHLAVKELNVKFYILNPGTGDLF